MTEAVKKTMNDAMSKVLKRLRYPIEVMLMCVRWYAAYPLSLRNLEETMAERGVVVDHTTVHRWAVKMLPGTTPYVSPAQAPGRPELAHGRDLRHGRRPIEVALPRGRQGRPDNRLFAARAP